MAVSSSSLHSTPSANDKIFLFFSWKGPTEVTNTVGSFTLGLIQLIVKNKESQIYVKLPKKIENPDQAKMYPFTVKEGSLKSTVRDDVKLTIEQIQNLTIKLRVGGTPSQLPKDNSFVVGVEHEVSPLLPEILEPSRSYCLKMTVENFLSYTARIEEFSSEDKKNREEFFAFIEEEFSALVHVEMMNFAMKFALTNPIECPIFSRNEVSKKAIKKQIKEIDQEALQKFMQEIHETKINKNSLDWKKPFLKKCCDLFTVEGLKNIIKVALQTLNPTASIDQIIETSDQFVENCMEEFTSYDPQAFIADRIELCNLLQETLSSQMNEALARFLEAFMKTIKQNSVLSFDATAGGRIVKEEIQKIEKMDPSVLQQFLFEIRPLLRKMKEDPDYQAVSQKKITGKYFTVIAVDGLKKMAQRVLISSFLGQNLDKSILSLIEKSAKEFQEKILREFQ